MTSIKPAHRISIAFYNLENFFDTYDDPNTADDAFTPKGLMHWIKKRFNNKAKKITYTISQIGLKNTGMPPVLVGLAEVENTRVLKNIVRHSALKPYNYNFVHYESADRRGMDVALLYRNDLFEVLQSKVFPVMLYSNEGEAYPTRDILYVQGQFENEIWHLLINHWPSRREGDFESNHKRYIAAQQLNDIIDPIYYENPDAKFILMGDFNTDPDDKNIKLLNKHFFNPAQNLYNHHQGSLNHHHKWHLFDQILFSHNFNQHMGWTFDSFHIYKPDFLQIWKNKKRHQPYRTYQGRHYQGGFSDHFPVYAILKHFKEL